MSSTISPINPQIKPQTARNELLPFDDLDTFFDDFLARRWPRFFSTHLPSLGLLERNIPRVDIIDHGDALEVQAALPGIRKDDIEVSLTQQTITLRTRVDQSTVQEGRYFRREIAQGEFQRTLSLPEAIIPENAKATFNDGILRLTIPKTESHKTTKIDID